MSKGIDDELMINVGQRYTVGVMAENRGYPSGQPVKLINNAQPLGIPHIQYPRGRSASDSRCHEQNSRIIPNLDGRSLKDSPGMYGLGAARKKKHVKRSVDPPGQIKSRPIGCIDTTRARGATNFHGRKGRRVPKEGSEKRT